MTSLAQRKPSRSICRNRWEQFATLYDPDTVEQEPAPEPAPGRRTPPTKGTRDPETGTVHIYLNEDQYAQRRRVMLAHNPHCTYCGRKLDANGKGSNIDHVLPRSRGGEDWPANLVLSCIECNRMKDNFTLPELLENIEEQLHILETIRENVTRMIEDGADCYPPVSNRGERKPLSRTVVQSVTEKRKVKRHDFQPGKRSYMVVRRNTSEMLFMDASLHTAVEFLKSDGADPKNPLRLIGYQELFNPEYNVPDWRAEEDQGELQAHE